jgi:hypothetical protein
LGGSACGDPSDPDEPDEVNEGLECLVEEDCRQPVLADLEELSRPQSIDFDFVASSCEVEPSTGTAEVSATVCHCELGDGGTRSIGPVGLGCYVSGRGGDCLWSDDEFSGCETRASSACAAPCSELGLRLEADAQRTFSAEILFTNCNEGLCQSVVAIEGECYVNRSYRADENHDCSLGAAAILEEHASGL